MKTIKIWNMQTCTFQLATESSSCLEATDSRVAALTYQYIDSEKCGRWLTIVKKKIINYRLTHGSLNANLAVIAALLWVTTVELPVDTDGPISVCGHMWPSPAPAWLHSFAWLLTTAWPAPRSNYEVGKLLWLQFDGLRAALMWLLGLIPSECWASLLAASSPGST